MNTTLPVDIKIASPCGANWDDMPGGDTVRSCSKCARKVYNLSEMPRADAADLIRAAEGRLCVRFYRRADGTIMTGDCPTGLRAVRIRAARMIGVAFASLLVWSGFSLSTRQGSQYPYLPQNGTSEVNADRIAAQQADGSPLDAPDRPVPDRAGHWMGAVSLPMAPQTTREVVVGTSPASVDKPFLRGLEVDNTPREDPFAPEAKPKKRSAK